MAENIVAQLKAVLRLGVDTRETEKANNAVKKFQEHMERAKAALKEGAFEGAIKDVEKINARFENARVKIDDLNKAHHHGQTLLKAQGAEQEKVNQLATAYLNILKQTVSIRGSSVTDPTTGKALLTPASRFDPGAAAADLPKETDFRRVIAGIEDDYRAFLARIAEANKVSAEQAVSTVAEQADARVAKEEAALDKVREALTRTAQDQVQVSRDTFDNISSLLQEFSKRATEYAASAGRAAAETERRVQDSRERAVKLQNQLNRELEHQIKLNDIYNNQAKLHGTHRAKEYKTALDNQRDVVLSLERQIRAEHALQRELQYTTLNYREKAAAAKSAVFDEAIKQFDNLRGMVSKYEIQVNELSTSLQKAADDQRKLLSELDKAKELLKQSTETANRRRQAQEINELSNAFRNLQAAAVVAMGPLSGLGARIASIGGVVARSGMSMAAGVTALGALLAGTIQVTNAAVSMRREFEAQIALLDLTRTATERVGESFKFIVQVADQYGLALQGLIGPITRLKAAAVGTDIAPMFKEFVRDIGAITGAFQLPTEAIARMTKALEQMLSKGIVQAEELRGQLGDVLPGSARVAFEAFREMTQQPLAAMRDFMDAMKRGEIESEKFLQVFLKKYQTLFGIDPDKPVDTLNAAYARLNTTFVQFVLTLDEAFGITEGVKVGINELASILRLVTSHMDTLVLAFRTFMTISLALLGIRIIAHFAALHTAILAANASMGMLALTAASFWNVMGVFGGAVLLLGAVTVAFNTMFGGISDDAAASNRALQEFGKSLDDVKRSMGTGNLFEFQSRASDTEKFSEELANFIKAAKMKLDEGIVLEPSINLDNTLTDAIATLRVRSTSLTEELSASLNESVKMTGDQLRELAQQTDDAGKKAFEALRAGQQAKELENLRGEYIKLSVSQQTMVQSVQEVGIVVRALDAALSFLANNANLFVTVGAVVVVTLRSIRSGLLGASAAAATTSGAFAALARRLNVIGLAAGAAGLALTLFSKDATAADISDSLAPPLERLREYISTVKDTGNIDLSTLRKAQELARQEINKVSVSLREAQDDLVKYQKTLRETGEGSGFTGLVRRIGPSLSMETLPEKIEALREGLITLKGVSAELDTIAAEVEQRLGAAYKGLFTTEDEASRVVADLQVKMEKLRTDIEVFSGARSQAALVAQRYADEEREVAKALAGTTLSTAEAKAMLEEYMALYQQRQQLEANSKLTEILTATEQRAVAARNGLMQQFDAQERVNEAVKRAEELAIESGLSQEEVNEKMAAYRANLLAIDEAQKRASGSAKTMKDKMQETSQIVQTISGPLNNFVNSLAGLASTGELSFKNFVGIMRELIADLIKDIIALIIKINVLDPLLKGLNLGVKSGTGFGGFLASAIGFSKGGIVDSPTFFSHNGGLGVAGEAGSEAILPLYRGPGGQLGVRSDSGGGRPVKVVFNITTPNAESFRRSESQLAAMAARVVGRGDRNL